MGITKNNKALNSKYAIRLEFRRKKRSLKKATKLAGARKFFTVTIRYPTQPPTYAIKDKDGELIEGKFYSQELQKVRRDDSSTIVSNTKEGDDDVYTVEKIIKTRQRNGKKQYLIHWLGYSNKHDSWVDNIII